MHGTCLETEHWFDFFVYLFDGVFSGGRGDVNFCCAVGFSLIRHAYDIHNVLHIIKILSEKIIFSLDEI